MAGRKADEEEQRLAEEQTQIEAEDAPRRTEAEERRMGQGSIPVGENQASAVPSAIVAALNGVDASERAGALADLARTGNNSAFHLITKCFDDDSQSVRIAAARALYDLEPHRTHESLNRALEEGSPERRRKIGAAMACSGLATNAINSLSGENREDTYNALCLLFVMAKAGEVEPLTRAIEEHEGVQVRRAAIKLLSLIGQPEIAAAAAKRRLMSAPSLPGRARRDQVVF